MPDVAEVLVDTLNNAGVKRIYGIVGDSLNGITNALQKYKQIEWIHVRHEGAGAFAAGAEAQLTGELAVCVHRVCHYCHREPWRSNPERCFVKNLFWINFALFTKT